MSLIRWDPVREMNDFFNRPIAATFGRWPRLGTEGAEADFEWAPTVDISETDTEYLVRADLPAVKKEEVKVTFTDGLLTIEGERKYDKEEKNERFQRRESFHGTFSRSLVLPDNADAGAIRAESKDGVLTVHIRKTKVEKAKAVEIKVQ